CPRGKTVHAPLPTTPVLRAASARAITSVLVTLREGRKRQLSAARARFDRLQRGAAPARAARVPAMLLRRASPLAAAAASECAALLDLYQAKRPASPAISAIPARSTASCIGISPRQEVSTI